MKKFLTLLISLLQEISNAQSVLNQSSVNPFLIRDIVGIQSNIENLFASKSVELFLPVSVYMNNGAAISSDVSVLSVPANTCSTFDKSVCYATADFYKTDYPQIIISSYYFYGKDDALILGVNTGYSSSKLSIEPSIELGFSKFINIRKQHRFAIEASTWLGGKIEHRPCVDSFNREYYCGNLSAWSDFKYQSTIDSYNMRVMYQWKF